MTAVLTGVTEAAVREALGTVIDPELDEAVTDLGFVRSVTVGGRTWRCTCGCPPRSARPTSPG